MLFEHHSHTTLCNHAYGEPEAYVEAALARGLAGLTVTCHNPMPGGFSQNVRMRMEEFPAYLVLVERARAHAETIGLNGIDGGGGGVRLGLECDYFPGHEDFLREQAGWGDFDYLLVSVHPTTMEYKAHFGDAREARAAEAGGPTLTHEQAWATYFDNLAASAELGLHDCISHPDLIKNPTKEWWDVDRAMEILTAAGGPLDRIAGTGIAMELNTSGVLKKIPEMNPNPSMLRAMREREIPVVLGADAHVPERVGDGYLTGLALLKSVGYETVRQFKQREAYDVSIDAALSHLQAHMTDA